LPSLISNASDTETAGASLEEMSQVFGDDQDDDEDNEDDEEDDEGQFFIPPAPPKATD
jgi:hypothetical protein